MRAGRLRHRVRIEELVDQRDGTGAVVQNPDTGGVSVVWSLVAQAWAAIEPLSAREIIASQAVQSQATTRITLRKPKRLDSSMRIVHAPAGVEPIIYNILGVLPDKKTGLEYVTIPASSGANFVGQ